MDADGRPKPGRGGAGAPMPGRVGGRGAPTPGWGGGTWQPESSTEFSVDLNRKAKCNTHKIQNKTKHSVSFICLVSLQTC